MMYQMKKIITHDDEIPLPKCMYIIKPIFTVVERNQPTKCNDTEEINISKQVKKFLQAPTKEMAELEKRQDQLLKKLDSLYDKIKLISSSCKVQSSARSGMTIKSIETPDEIVLTAGPDNLPWFINIVLKKITSPVNFTWHIHSSVATEKVPKIKAFVKNLPFSDSNSKVSVRLIFKNVSADSELKLSSLAVPIVGTVNILRYLSLVYPNVIPYDDEDFASDALLDLCHTLERTNEKNKEAVVKKLFSQFDGWIYKGSFSVVDLAAFNVIKEWRNCPKYVPKEWFAKLSNSVV